MVPIGQGGNDDVLTLQCFLRVWNWNKTGQMLKKRCDRSSLIVRQALALKFCLRDFLIYQRLVIACSVSHVLLLVQL